MDNDALINYEIYKHNMAIEERFNCHIRMETFPEMPDETLPNKAVEAAIMAGDVQYGLLMTHMMDGVSTAMI